MVADPQDRVSIWNTYFKLAWTEVKQVFELANECKCTSTFEPEGGTLPPKEFHTLAALALCNLAIEARANHLLDELLEAGNVSEDVAKAARWLPTKEKWFLIPALAGASTTMSADSAPHQAIAQICELRNDLMHVNYEKLKTRLPKPGTLESYFENFVHAMEDMNVILGRIEDLRPVVLKIGKFRCS